VLEGTSKEGSGSGTPIQISILESVEDNKGDTEAWSLDKVKELLSEERAPEGINNASTTECTNAQSQVLGMEVCGDLAREAKLLENTANVAITTSDGQMSLTTAWTNINSKYQRHLGVFKRIIAKLQANQMPDELLDMFQANCAQAFRECTKQPDKKEAAIRLKLARIVQIGKEAGNDRMFAVIASPCVEESDIIQQYRVKALPYQEEAKTMKLAMPVTGMEIWVRKKSDGGHALVNKPTMCTAVDAKLFNCPSQEITESEGVIKGTLEKMTIALASKEADEKVKVIDLPKNELLLALTEEHEATYDCPNGNHVRREMIKGINKVDLPEHCKVKIPTVGLTLQGKSSENEATWQERTASLVKDTLLWKTVNDGVLNKVEKPWRFFDSGYATEEAVEHVRMYWAYYMGGTLGISGLFLILMIGMVFWSNRPRCEARRGRKRRRQLVVVRNMTV
jgi:hypothetical protein